MSGMFFRRRERTALPHERGDVFGVGMQVYVLDDPGAGAEGWVGDPTGVIVSVAHSAGAGPLGRLRLGGRTWVVAFDSPQYRADGRGPYERAEIVETSLIAAPPIEER
jgi:hypothetical protein